MLTELADTMCQAFRSTDRLFRYGGEEFFILMPETEKTAAERVANRARETVKHYPFKLDEQQAAITISIGCILYPEQAKDAREVLKYADKAMYQAKETGRDRVIFYA